MYWGAGRECRHSKTRRGIGASGGHLGAPWDVGVLGAVMGVRGVLGW